MDLPAFCEFSVDQAKRKTLWGLLRITAFGIPLQTQTQTHAKPKTPRCYGSAGHPFGGPVGQSAGKPAGQSASGSVDQSASGPVNQWAGKLDRRLPFISKCYGRFTADILSSAQTSYPMYWSGVSKFSAHPEQSNSGETKTGVSAHLWNRPGLPTQQPGHNPDHTFEAKGRYQKPDVSQPPAISDQHRIFIFGCRKPRSAPV